MYTFTSVIMLVYVCKEKEQQPEREVEKMKTKLNNGVTVKLFEPSAYMSDNAFYAYSNSDYKIAIEEHNYYNWYYIVLNNNVVCGPTDWVEVQEFFNDLYKLSIE